MLCRAVLIVVLAIAAAVPSAAAERVLELDPGASTVRFTLGATLHTVRGTVPVERGTVRFDPATGDASGEVVAAARGADTGNDGRDEKMHEEVLKSGEFPVATLVPVRFEGELAPQGTSTITVHGRLTLLGTPHEVAIPLQVLLEGDRATVRGRFVVPYVEWGLEDPSTFLLRVAKEVEVEIEATGRLVDSPPPAG